MAIGLNSSAIIKIGAATLKICYLISAGISQLLEDFDIIYYNTAQRVDILYIEISL